MMAGGHFSEYLIYWQNLYHHSQQEQIEVMLVIVVLARSQKYWQ